MSNLALSDQEKGRRETLTKLREYGIDPYPAALYPVKDKAKPTKENYEEGQQVTIAGRLMRRKIQGKASFGDIQDDSGRIQVYFKRDEICPGEDKSMYNDVFK
jgi:lysyl-tRNA synthetase class 2